MDHPDHAPAAERVDDAELLDGLTGEARRQRVELIDWLLSQGVSREQIRESAMPMLLASQREIGEDGDYISAREISRHYGVGLDLLQRVLRAVGLSRVDDVDAAVHLRSDGAAAAHVQRFLDVGIDPDDMVQVVRVLAQGLSNAAEVMRYASLAAVLQPGATELQTAQRSRDLVHQVAPLLGPWITDMLFMYLRHQLETEAVTTSEQAAGHALPGARRVGVAFADLVGFTRLGEMMSPEELERLANRLAQRAREVATPPVRLIKTIGDAVMFVSPEPAPLLDTVLSLVEIAGTEPDFPRLRAGAALGEAVSRAGDWFGSPVNLASRVTGVARPGSVLVAESLIEAVPQDRFRWSFAGARRLKGIRDDVKLFRARRVEPDS